MKSSHRVLIVDDEKSIRDVLSASLMDEGYTVESAYNGEKALRMMDEFKPEIVLLDIWMPGRLDGVEVLKESKIKNPDIDFVIMSGHGTIETAVTTTKYGAWDFVEKPLSIEKVLILINNIIELQYEKRERKALLNHLRTSIELVGNSPEIKTLKQNIGRIALTSQSVFLKGEVGVGKALVAQNIHCLSASASRPFVSINSKTISPHLLEGEVFGFNKSAVVGAEKNYKGKLELAEGGTLYINEITKCSPVIQQKILNFINTKKFKKVGSEEEHTADVRIILATSENIQGPEQLHNFNVIPLRERLEDIAYLVEHFSRFYAKESGVPTKEFSTESLELLKTYIWPGNVRELKNFIERIYILHTGEKVDVPALQLAGFVAEDDEDNNLNETTSLKMARALFEKRFILRRLQDNKGNVTKTADQIGVERSHLHRKIKGYGIESQG